MGFQSGHSSLNKVGLPPPTAFTRGRPRPRIRQLLSSVFLFSLAATLSTILPTPWSLYRSGNTSRLTLKVRDPAEDWQDNVWPLRPPTPWDISTDYPYPRKLEYDVEEGTWLRLDVHPTSSDIVFDMVGDLWCLPGEQALRTSDATVKARPVLLGIPHDSDPHFSPNGDRLVFRSDAELGVENIWVMEWKGCYEMDLRSTTPRKELLIALNAQEIEQRHLSQGLKENSQQKMNRLLREGRLNGTQLILDDCDSPHVLTARRVTNETYRWVSDPRFHPSGNKVIATKWYTSSRSLGAGEGWEYEVPSVGDLRRDVQLIQPGSGKRLVARSLPLGWTAENYGDQQIGPEQLIWKGKDSIVFSKNVVDASQFVYSKGGFCTR